MPVLRMSQLLLRLLLLFSVSISIPAASNVASKIKPSSNLRILFGLGWYMMDGSIPKPPFPATSKLLFFAPIPPAPVFQHSVSHLISKHKSWEKMQNTPMDPPPPDPSPGFYLFPFQ